MTTASSVKPSLFLFSNVRRWRSICTPVANESLKSFGNAHDSVRSRFWGNPTISKAHGTKLTLPSKEHIFQV
jgi:CRISPR/Cas system endoribonuclease Cas6 (RAMP superfamily)